MSRKESKKKWQEANPDKARAYTAKYQEKKKKVSVTLDEWVAEEIDKIKSPEQPLGGWIREKLEKWAESRKSMLTTTNEKIF